MDKETLRQMIADYRKSLTMMEAMLDRADDPDASSPLVKHLLPEVPKVEPQMPLLPPSRSGLLSTHGPSSPWLSTPPPQPPQPAGPSNTLKAIESWDQIIFRPALASAMLYVIMPVVERLIDTGTTKDERDEAIRELDTWGKLTIAQRVALEDLFMWINDQLNSADSVIPMQVLSNMAAATAAYDAAS